MTSMRENIKVNEGNIAGTYTNSNNTTNSHNPTNSHNTTNSNNRTTRISIGLVALLLVGATGFVKLGGLQVFTQSPSEQQRVDKQSPVPQEQNLPSKESIFNQGQVIVLDYGTQKKVSMRAMPSYSANARGVSWLIVDDIPLSQYQSRLIKVNNNSQINGSLRYFNDKTNTANEYKLNTEGTDLTLQLNKNPVKKGEFVEGLLSGTVTNGVDKEKVSFRLVLPVQ
jgi:hypothetical protein